MLIANEARLKLRHAIAADDVVVAPGVFDGVSAWLVRRLGFTAGYMTGAGVAASEFGLPDIGLLTQTEMTERLGDRQTATHVRFGTEIPFADRNTEAWIIGVDPFAEPWHESHFVVDPRLIGVRGIP